MPFLFGITINYLLFYDYDFDIVPHCCIQIHNLIDN